MVDWGLKIGRPDGCRWWRYWPLLYLKRRLMLAAVPLIDFSSIWVCVWCFLRTWTGFHVLDGINDGLYLCQTQATFLSRGYP